MTSKIKTVQELRPLLEILRAFFTGSTGVIYRQFSVTIIASMLLSVLVALILTPVLCASLLKPVPKGHEPAEGGIWFVRPFFRWFDRLFFRARDLYLGLVGHSLAKKLRYIALFLVIVAAMGLLFQRMPSAYLPDEDQGMMMVQTMLPANSTQEQHKEIMSGVKDSFLEHEKDAVETVMTVSGVSFSGRGQNSGLGERAEAQVEKSSPYRFSEILSTCHNLNLRGFAKDANRVSERYPRRPAVLLTYLIRKPGNFGQRLSVPPFRVVSFWYSLLVRGGWLS